MPANKKFNLCRPAGALNSCFPSAHALGYNIPPLPRLEFFTGAILDFMMIPRERLSRSLEVTCGVRVLRKNGIASA
jgi:hypothetical protein